MLQHLQRKQTRMETTMTTETPLQQNDAPGRKINSFACRLPTIARILMGLLFFVIGLNGFLNFIPPPPTPMPAGAIAFSVAMLKTGYLFQMVAATQIVVGALLLANRFVPLALALIAPVVVNIIAFHLFLAPAGIGPGIVVALLEIYLAWAYRKSFRPMLAMRAEPNAT